MTKSAIRHSYNLPGITDMSVMRLQAERRRDQRGETTIIHDHPYKNKDSNIPLMCNGKCMVYEEGYDPHPVDTYPVKKALQ